MGWKYYDRNIGMTLATPPDDGFGLFARVAGGFVLGSVLAALTTTTVRLGVDADSGSDRFRLAICTDVGTTLLGVCILVAALGFHVSRSKPPLRSRHFLASVASGCLYQVIPLGLALTLTGLQTTAAAWVPAAAAWSVRFLIPWVAPWCLVRRPR